jgi:hypothetical protein
MRDSLYKRKVSIQANGVERRLRELIFECVGEFEKGRIRGVRRSEYLDETVNKELNEKVSVGGGGGGRSKARSFSNREELPGSRQSC